MKHANRGNIVDTCFSHRDSSIQFKSNRTMCNTFTVHSVQTPAIKVNVMLAGMKS